MGNALKNLFVLAIGAVAAIYLLNPTAGFIEFIPDVVPVIGNLDEATAVLLLTNVFAYYGFDLTRLFGRGKNEQVVVEGQAKKSSL